MFHCGRRGSNRLTAVQGSIRGLQRQLRAHEQRLSDYRDDPLAFDNDGRLARALSEGNMGRASSIIRGRIQNLQRQIENFRRQIEAKQMEELEIEFELGGEAGEAPLE
jgi:hypothetical protein